jgi:hypothetical protein
MVDIEHKTTKMISYPLYQTTIFPCSDLWISWGGVENVVSYPDFQGMHCNFQVMTILFPL